MSSWWGALQEKARGTHHRGAWGGNRGQKMEAPATYRCPLAAGRCPLGERSRGGSEGGCGGGRAAWSRGPAAGRGRPGSEERGGGR